MNGIFWPQGSEPNAVKVCTAKPFTSDYFQQKRCIPPFVKGTPKHMFSNIFDMETEFLFKARLTVCHSSQQIFFQCCKIDHPQNMYSGCSFFFKERVNQIYHENTSHIVKKKHQLSIQKIEKQNRENCKKNQKSLWESTDSENTEEEEPGSCEEYMYQKEQELSRKKTFIKEVLNSKCKDSKKTVFEVPQAKMLPNSASEIKIKLIHLDFSSDPYKEKEQWLHFFLCSCRCSFLFRLDSLPVNLWNK